ncbi:MAG: acVLRF1 family peptidyl-tRNA hydrolase [Motilibacteraceae bacterium]
MSGRPAAGGGRWVEVAPERLARWCENFAERHGGASSTEVAEGLSLVGSDGARAVVGVPPYADDDAVGLLLVRRGGYAAGVDVGGSLVASKVGSRHVQGRTAAGGWSQQRFARRREGQTREAVQAAAEPAARVLLPHAGELVAVVTGGDRTLVADVLEDPRLAPLRPLVAERFLDVADPKRDVLEQAAARARCVLIHLLP